MTDTEYVYARIRFVMAVALVGVLLSASPAYAHASLVFTFPANGQRLDQHPGEIVLRFSERVSTLHDGVRLVDAGGRTVSRAQAAVAAGRADEVRLPVPAGLAAGNFTVIWRVVSADSHPINGAFVYIVGTDSAASGQQVDTDAVNRPVTVVFWLLRWLGFAALALLLGGAFFLVVCWPAGWSRTRARRLIWAGWVGSLGCAVGALLVQGPYVAGAGLARIGNVDLLGEVIRTDYGRSVLARIGLLFVFGPVLWRLANGGALPGEGAMAVLRQIGLVALALVTTLTWLGTGHANAGPAVRLVTDTVHLAAMSIWVGGLIMMLAGVLRRRQPPDAAEATAAVARFSRVAFLAVVALATTGVWQAWLGLGGFAALTGSEYGRLLFIKVAGVGLLISLGAISRSVVQRRYLAPAGGPAALLARAGRPGSARYRAAQAEYERSTVRHLRRSVRMEMVVVAVVLGVTAGLVATPPGTHEHAVAATTRYTGPVHRTLGVAGVGNVLYGVEPARPGTNRMTADVRDAAGALRDVPEVSARLWLDSAGLGPLDVAFTRTAPGLFVAEGVTIPASGTWRVEVAVRTADFDVARVSTDLPVA